MLATIAIWFVAFSAAWGHGGLLCPRVPGRATIESLACRAYAGILIVAATLLGLALLTKLSPWMGLLVATPGMILAARDAHWRSFPSLTAKVSLLCFPLALFVTGREVNFYDTALYHQQAVQWLADYGVVKGIALVHFRLGFTSSWFAFAAPLNHSLLSGRLGSIIGGLSFGLSLMPGCAIMVAFLAKRSMTFESAAWLMFVGLIVAVSILWNVDVSLSPDPLIWLLPAIAVTMLTSQAEGEILRIGPTMIISALACLVKLNAAPVFAYCCALALLHFVRDAPSRKRLVGSFAVSAGLITLLIYANVRASGCPVFPSPFGCISAEWSVGRQATVDIENQAEAFAQSNRHQQTTPLLLAATLATLLSIARLKTSPFVRHSLGICWSGIVFVLATAPAPSLRYGMGYFLWPTAIAGADFGRRLMGKATDLWLRQAYIRLPGSVTAAAGVGIGWCVVLIHAGNSNELLYPRRMAASGGDAIHILNRQIDTPSTLSLQHQQHDGLVVWIPTSSDQCWDAPLPCTPGLTFEDVTQRESGRGFAAGFARRPGLFVRK